MHAVSSPSIVTTAAAISLDSFNASLRQIWSSRRWRDPPPKRVGLAISGGVDSMALASLCSRLQQVAGVHHRFTAFVVDHKLRAGSREEAHLVRDRLERIHGIPARILTIDSIIESELKHVETIARRYRYRALGAACADAGIGTLVTAHHGDDQVATLLTRMLRNHVGTGLRGMRNIANIPECDGMYGVHQSGSPRALELSDYAPETDQTHRILLEGGGVRVIRPLLNYTKAQLVATCVDANVEWAEDSTNADKTYAIRNTLTYLQQNNLLPAALSSPRLQRVRDAVIQTDEELEGAIEDCLQIWHTALDPGTGHLSVKVPVDHARQIENHPQASSIKERLLQVLSSVVTQSAGLERSHFRQSANLFLDQSQERCVISHIGNIVIEYHGSDGKEITYAFMARNPPSSRRFSQVISTNIVNINHSIHWSAWNLWDGRYWIRVGHADSSAPLPSRLLIRNLRKDDARLVPEQHVEQFRAAVREAHLADRARFSLPVLTIAAEDQPDGRETEVVVALPSLGWSISEFHDARTTSQPPTGTWRYEIRYKKVPSACNIVAAGTSTKCPPPVRRVGPRASTDLI